MGYYKLKCGCVVKILKKNNDNTYQYVFIANCNNHKESWTLFPDKFTTFHPESYGAIQLSKFEASIEKLQGNQ